jgi:hypothetical protein
VCPRCGDEVGEGRFCKTCGLDLHKQTELPTRSEWEARPEKERQRSIRSGAPFANGPRHVLSSLSTLQKVAGLALIVAAVAALTYAKGGSDSSEKDGGERTEPQAVDVDAGPPPEQRCVDLWNQSQNFGQTHLRGYTNFTDVYLSVDFAAAFPDKCLITAFMPNVETAFQYLEGGVGGQVFSTNEISLDTPPPFNALANPDGTIALQP